MSLSYFVKKRNQNCVCEMVSDRHTQMFEMISFQSWGVTLHSALVLTFSTCNLLINIVLINHLNSSVIFLIDLLVVLSQSQFPVKNKTSLFVAVLISVMQLIFPSIMYLRSTYFKQEGGTDGHFGPL